MGRLKTKGSSSDLRRALFPHGFAGGVMLLIYETWRCFSMHRTVRHEEAITALLVNELVNACDEFGWPWIIVPEVPVSDSNFGTELGRNDIVFFHRSISQRIHFTVECKRLHVRTSSGFKHLADKYVDEGLLRFTQSRYSAGLPCGGMVAYVMDNDLDTAFDRVKSEILSRSKELKMAGAKSFYQPSSALKSLSHSADTNHHREDGDFLVHHLLLGVLN